MSIDKNCKSFFYYFCAAHLLYKVSLDNRDKIPAFLIFGMVVQDKKSGISSLYLV